MDTTSSTARLTATLITVRACVRDEHEASLSQALEYERLVKAKIALESDALDHQIAHLV
jgi:hypothetical protein